MNNHITEIEKLGNKLSKYRIVLGMVLAILFVAIGFCYWGSNAPHKYQYLDESVSNADSRKNLIVNIQPLREYLDELEIEYMKVADVSIYFEMLDTGANTSVNRSLKIWPVSLAKVPLAMAVMKKIENSGASMSLDDEISFIPDDFNTHSGPLFNDINVGDKLSVRDLIYHMLNSSDNTAYRALLRTVDQAYLQDVVDLIGVDDMFQEDGKVSSKEYMRLFRSLYYSTFLHPDSSEFLLKTLANSDFSDFLGSGIPEGVAFAHKWGENVMLRVYADSGIVFVPGKPYMISVMLEMKSDDSKLNREKAKEIMNKASQSAYKYVSEYIPE